MFDVIIGKPNGIQYCSAVRLRDYEDISENRDQYWVHNVLDRFHGGMKIFKNSDVGIALASRIASKDTEESIFEWLKLEFIRHAPPEKILTIIERISAEQFEKGKESNQYEMRRVLGLED